jgi:N6-adenosine-specific RNA methylase IME4
MELPNKKYQIIYADPPWKFNNRAYQDNDREPIEPNAYYKIMETQDICNLPIKNIRANDSALFIWTTDAHLPDCLQVMSAWGFEYRTIAFVWIKKYASGIPCVLVAPWTLKSTEICLLGIYGNPKRKSVNVYALIEAKRTKHSKKPNEVRNRIVKLFGDVSRIELFARERFEGWDYWGDELSNTIQKLIT